MQLVTKIHLFSSHFTIFYMTERSVMLSSEQCSKSLGLKADYFMQIDYEVINRKTLKLVTNALFLRPFVKECLNSIVYRVNVLMHMKKLTGVPNNGTVFLKLILEPPDKEIIDYAWNDRILRLVWSRVEIENAFSWLSTLGGAYSALGDYFEHCAEEAGRISIRQYKLSKMLGDDSLAARSRLYSALSHAQKGDLKLSRHIVRNVAAFAKATNDKRLIRMCHGVWVKLKYLRVVKKNSISHKIDDLETGNGKVNNLK